MFVLIWDYVDELTDHYHDGGGLLIVASDLRRAKTMAREAGITRELGDPTYRVRAEAGEKELLVVFPDAGCC